MQAFDVKLSEPKIVMTKYGEKSVRSGAATESFWNAWRANKEELKKLGWGVSKKPDGSWQVALWADTANRKERDVAAAASRAQEIDPNIELPVPAGQTLLPYQRAGIVYALSRPGVLIADEMGLGKTIQAIAAANASKAQRILVVCPASLKLNWRREISKWQTLDLPISVIDAGDRLHDVSTGWFIINYDIAGRDEYSAQLKSNKWDVLILDEAHYLKNSRAKRTQTILGNRKNGISAIPAARKIILTGTPISNRPAELFTLINALDPARWPSFFSYAKRYCDGHNNGYGFEAKGATNLEELQARLRETIMVRRLKKDVLKDLPAKRRQVITLAVDSAAIAALVKREREFYETNKAKVEAANAAIAQAKSEDNEEAHKAAMLALHEAEEALFTEMSKIRHEVALAKMPHVIEHLDNCGDKAVIFAHHRDVVQGIVAAIEKNGDKAVSITGDTPQQKRDDAVQAFQNDPSVRFFVGNMQAAGVGLTLTAASHVIFAELDWVPGTLTQAEDRCHRIGQTDSVLVQHIVLDGSLDAKLASTLIEKQEVIEKALDRETKVDVSGQPMPDRPTAPARPVAAVPAPVAAKRAQLDEIASTLTPERIEAIHRALKQVAASDADRARDLNGVGFSKLDTGFGTDLAAKNSLSPRQAAAAMRLVRKYRRQYDPALYETIFGEARS